ncbi:hypothetical protein [Microbacterium paulum]
MRGGATGHCHPASAGSEASLGRPSAPANAAPAPTHMVTAPAPPRTGTDAEASDGAADASIAATIAAGSSTRARA